MALTDVRLRTKAHPDTVSAQVGKLPTPASWDVMLTGPAYVRKPDGKPLAVYLPGALKDFSSDPSIYAILHDMRKLVTMNRGLASGGKRAPRGTQNRSYALPVASGIVGAVDPGGIYKFCRLTAWTGENLPQWQQLHPMLRAIAQRLEQHVPDRYANQARAAREADPAWVVPGTPFSTVTVNNTYSTGVHTDKGDLEAGFSTIACVRRGEYTGGQLVFPEYRVAVDMRDGDLLLMDAHEWHGNAGITCGCEPGILKKACAKCGAERISVVSYFRTRIATCGTPDEEAEKARRRREMKLPEEAEA